MGVSSARWPSAAAEPGFAGAGVHLRVPAHHLDPSIQPDKPPVHNWERRRISEVTLGYILFVHSPAVLSLLGAAGHLSQWCKIILRRY